MKMYKQRYVNKWHYFIDCPVLRGSKPEEVIEANKKPEKLKKKEACRHCSRRYNANNRVQPTYVKEHHYVVH